MDERKIYRTRRKIPAFNTELIREVISNNAEYLAGTVQENGRFIYGYFPCFDTQVKGYNCARHAQGVFALADVYLLTKKESLLDAMTKILNYLTTELIYVDDRAYVVDYENNNEIRLGALSLSILAITKYMDVFGIDEKYMNIMTSIENDILSMQDKETGKFFHVLRYPDLEAVDEFKTIYYAGEAAYALRLYSFDKNEKWLNGVKKLLIFLSKMNIGNIATIGLPIAQMKLLPSLTTTNIISLGLKMHLQGLISSKTVSWHTIHF